MTLLPPQQRYYGAIPWSKWRLNGAILVLFSQNSILAPLPKNRLSRVNITEQDTYVTVTSQGQRCLLPQPASGNVCLDQPRSALAL
ncbi:MAG: hypothetical protein ACKVQA_26170, partial [Burkholderiales bacterium]